MEDPKFKRGFKFDHVWDIVKDFANLQDNHIPSRKDIMRNRTVYELSQSDNHTPNSSSSIGISDFIIDLNIGMLLSVMVGVGAKFFPHILMTIFFPFERVQFKIVLIKLVLCEFFSSCIKW